MKPRTLLTLCALPLILCGCKGKAPQTTTDANADSTAVSATPLPDSLFFMLRDEPLPRHVDLTQDISRLSYGCLRLLRSYVYATHGHWFMEGDLNRFFCNHAPWYSALCDSMWLDYDYNNVPRRVDEYNMALTEDYPKTYGMIELTTGELAFVERIDRRMRELERTKHVTSAEGVSLLNPDLAVNMFQMLQPDSSFRHRLRETNIALQPASYQQLFNIYEANDYYCIPNFVTTDVMLQAYHMYFTYVLKSLETDMMAECLHDALRQMLMECQLRMSVSPELRMKQDMNNAIYCAVALRLLGFDALEEKEFELLRSCMQGKPMNTYEREIRLVEKAEDGMSPLFATATEFPYSLFKPRGHYTRNEASRHYFRAMMWLQRGCFRRQNTNQLRQAVSLASLLGDVPSAHDNLRRIDRALTFLMGEPDNVSILDLADYMSGQGFRGSGVCMDDRAVENIDSWLRRQFLTHNRIRPKEQNEPADELNLLPGRYSLDGEILSHLYDPAQDAPRAYPSGLDVMDVLGVPAAATLVRERNDSLPWAGYAKEREALTRRMEQFGDWDKTMYNKWMHTLLIMQQQGASQSNEGRDAATSLPPFMQTGGWQLKNLNTALASWALLKHDAILYCEQPIAAECGAGGLPDPDVPGYVEPNLPFWTELEGMLALCQKMLRDNGFLTDLLRERGETLADMAALCRRAAERELAGRDLSSEDHGAIRRIGSSLEWFTLSVINPDTVQGSWDEIKGADRCVAQVADVFTRNITSCPRDGILYEATGMPTDLYVVVEIRGQHYLARGSTYSYHEFVRPLGDRLTDEQWQEMLQRGTAPAVPQWFAPMLMQGAPANPDERFIYSTGC